MTDVEIRKAVPLRTLPAIELAAVGTWRASTGETTFTVRDFADAVAALDCPGVRNPVLKLGHDEEDSTGGVRWDGEPAVGWIANMRMNESGTKLIGDYTGVPDWLADVMPSAYPDRSIEIYRPFRCQIGHWHPSVITAVALLGVMPPGVGVLRSMQDVYAAFTVTDAAGDKAEATAPVAVTLPLRVSHRADAGHAAASRVTERPPLVLRRNPTPTEMNAATDFAAVQTAWEDELDALIAEWREAVTPAERKEVLEQIEELTEAGAYDQLGALTITAATVGIGATLLAAYMLSAVDTAIELMIEEAGRQGVTGIDPAPVDEGWLRDRAGSAANLLATGYAQSAGRQAAARAVPGADPKEVARAVAEHLDALADRALRDQLGAALTAAQNAGRLAVMAGADEVADYYAVEILDRNTCPDCADIDGAKFDSLADASAAYLTGGYVNCQGRERCRGIVVAVWAPNPDRAAVATTVRLSIG
jgi:hypothetical protein